MAKQPTTGKPGRRGKPKKADRIGELERRIKELEDDKVVRDAGKTFLDELKRMIEKRDAENPIRPLRPRPSVTYPWNHKPEPWVLPQPPRKPWGDEFPYRPPVVWL